MSFLESAIASSRQHADACFDAFLKSVGSNPSPPQLLAAARGGGILADFNARADANHHAEQFRHNRDRPYSIIRLISQRIARQPIRVARLHDKGNKERQAFWNGRVKAFDAAGKIVSASRLELLPAKYKAMADNLEPYETHPLLTTLADPNPVMTSWGLKYTAVSHLLITGKAFWWTTANGQPAPARATNLTPGPAEPASQIWPILPSWMTPIHEPSIYAAWECRPNEMAKGFKIPSENVVYFYEVDPANPLLGALSPLQANGRRVAIGESISNAQKKGFDNSLNPDLLISIGRHPELATGEKQRPMLTKEQREQIIRWVKSMYRGTERNHDPLILDALIEDVRRLDSGLTREMDHIKSSVRNDEQLDQGFLVNSISMGRVEGANRASSVMADEHLVSNVLAPLCEQMSEVMTEWLGPQYARPGEKLVVFLEEIKTSDPDYILNEDKVLIQGCLSKFNEMRERHHLPAIPEFDDYIVTPQGPMPMPKKGEPLMAKPAPPQPPPGGKPGEPPAGAMVPKPTPPKPPKKPNKTMASLVRKVAMLARAPALPSPAVVNNYIAAPAAPPAPNVSVAPTTVNVAPPTVNVAAARHEINIQPPNVTVESPTVNVEAPAVNVESPTVNVAQPAITVLPPSVHIDFPVTEEEG